MVRYREHPILIPYTQVTIELWGHSVPYGYTLDCGPALVPHEWVRLQPGNPGVWIRLQVHLQPPCSDLQPTLYQGLPSCSWLSLVTSIGTGYKA